MKKVLIFLIIIWIVAVAAVLYFKKSPINSNNSNESKPSTSQNQKKEDEIIGEEISIDSDIVKELYSIIEVYNFGVEEVNFHRDKKITINDLDNNFKLLAIFNKCFLEGLNTHIHESQGWGNLSLKDTQDVSKRIFGKDAKVEFTSLRGYSMEFLFNEKKKIYETEINQKTGGLNPNVNDYMKVVKASKDVDTIYIYDKFVRVTGLANDPKPPKVGVYATSDKKQVIDEDISQDYLNEIVSKYNNADAGGETPENFELYGLTDKYGDKILTYRHTFKKDINNNYYWVSSEPLK